jgi:DNA-binding MarR family transcriptional regulator
MAKPVEAAALIDVFAGAITDIVRSDTRDLSARQLAVFLRCYLVDGDHTVRGLAERLNVSKPAITRALDRLGDMDLARRKVDPKDRRSVLVQRTLRGTAYLREIKTMLADASKGVNKKAA